MHSTQHCVSCFSSCVVVVATAVVDDVVSVIVTFEEAMVLLAEMLQSAQMGPREVQVAPEDSVTAMTIDLEAQEAQGATLLVDTLVEGK